MRGTNHVVSFAAAGFSIGWLVGLSLSPVLQTVLGSVVAVTASALAVLAGVNRLERPDEEKPPTKALLPTGLSYRVNAVPVAVFCVALAVGASVGLFARENDFLGRNPSLFAHQWRGTELERAVLMQRLLESSLAGTPSSGKEAAKETPHQHGGGLYAVTVTDCNLLRSANDAELRSKLLLVLNESPVGKAVKKCQEQQCYVAVREALCASGK